MAISQKPRKGNTAMSVITLSQHDTKVLVRYLDAFSDKLTAEHQASHSGVDQLLLISAIQDIDLLAVNLKEQLAKVTASEPVYTPIKLVEA